MWPTFSNKQIIFKVHINLCSKIIKNDLLPTFQNGCYVRILIDDFGSAGEAILRRPVKKCKDNVGFILRDGKESVRGLFQGTVLEFT